MTEFSRGRVESLRRRGAAASGVKEEKNGRVNEKNF
jgi:hypothetical protein